MAIVQWITTSSSKHKRGIHDSFPGHVNLCLNSHEALYNLLCNNWTMNPPIPYLGKEFMR